MSFVLGLTGPTGAGKTAVCGAAEKLGFKIVNCDALARKAVEKGSDGLSAVILAFGEDILAADGTLDRGKLAKKAFSSKEKTQLLNEVLLPHITKLVKAQIDTELVLLDAPTLFESGADSLCDKTVAVLADTDIRKARITRRDGIDEAAATLRINAGKCDDFYKTRADFVVYNNGDFDEFEKDIMSVFKNILGGI